MRLAGQIGAASMVPTRRAELKSAWTGLYLTITNIRHYVLREREMDGSSTVPLDDFPDVTRDVVRIARLLVAEVRDEHLDGPCVEYFVQNDVAETMVSLAVENIPEGLLDLAVGLYSALLSSLPPSFFLNSRIAAPLRTLLVACNGLISAKDAKPTLLQFFDTLTLQIQQYPPLGEILLAAQDSKPAFFSMLQHFLEKDVPETDELILRILEAGMVSGPEGEGLLISLVFSLVKVFAHMPMADFIRRLDFLERCLQAGRQDPQLPSQLISVYRDHFVDRIFAATMQGSSPADGSLAQILDLLIEIGGLVDAPDLYIPLLSRAIRILERMPEGESARVKVLHGRTLASGSLCRCFPTKKPTHWTESVSLHRQRLNSLMAHLPETGLAAFNDPGTVSDFYRMHLLAMDRHLGSDLAVKSYGSDGIPQIAGTGLVLDGRRNTRLMVAILKCKNELRRLWHRPVVENLTTVGLLMGAAAVLDTAEFYDELGKSTKGPESILSILRGLLRSGEEEKIAVDDGIVEPMFGVHMQHDPLDALRWDLSAVTGSAVAESSANAYLLGHAFMRLSAILQARATRSSVSIIYE